MIQLRHRIASGSLTNLWEWSGTRILAVVQLGSASAVDIVLEVCSERRACVGAFSLSRVDSTSWRLAAACYRREPRTGALVARPTPFHEALPIEPLMLLSAPEPVSEDLAAL